MLALGFAYFNFCRPHQTLTEQTKEESENGKATPTTPAMAAGIETKPWTLRELVEISTQY